MKNLLLLACLTLIACKKDAPVEAVPVKAPEAVKEAVKAAEAPKPAAPAEGWVVLEKMGMKIEMPPGSRAEDTSADAPNYSVAPEDYAYTVMVSTVTPAYASTYEAAVAEVKKHTNGFKAFSKNEKTADGWVLEFEGASLVDKEPLFGVVVRKKVGETSVECARNEHSVAARDAVARACVSLAKN
jgi:hypothetical protein